ncbi:hypothetical protein RvY_02147 [Ramazzottius varieornatus]|uniref:C3H1-type domain-containing protein n=1 Tax=Ramazzottius varieornatus TaxID=947166 RepID=A0A1D1UMH2_RAMVA|nr:hypothetical protein RvY_02147 [Ramazzottius varieornatus]
MSANSSINGDSSKSLLSPKCYYKTQLCRDFLTSPYGCPSGWHCGYAHGEHELRIAQVPTYKTKPCHRLYKDGYCKYGERCIFIHPCDMLTHQSTAPASSMAFTNPTKALKTKTCHRMVNYGFCPSGESCPFIHPAENAQRTWKNGGKLDEATIAKNLASWNVDMSLSSVSPSVSPSAISQLSTGSTGSISPVYGSEWVPEGASSDWMTSWMKEGFVETSNVEKKSTLAENDTFLNVVESVLHEDEGIAGEEEYSGWELGKRNGKAVAKSLHWNVVGTEASWWK